MEVRKCKTYQMKKMMDKANSEPSNQICLKSIRFQMDINDAGQKT